MAASLVGVAAGARRLAFSRLFLIAALLASAAPGQAQAIQFSTSDRLLLAEYRAIGRARAPLLIATTPAKTAAVAAALEKRGAQIVGRRDIIGYLYARVPLEAVASVLSLTGLEAVQVASLPVRAEASDSATTKRVARGPAPTADLPADNPYTSEAVTQALDFKTRHPTFDGRGVVTAFVEPLAPNLETMRGALDLAGRPLPKLDRYEVMESAAVAEAVADAPNQFVVWQKTARVTPGADGAFRWRDRDYRLPEGFAPGGNKWRICRRLATAFIPEYDILWAENLQRVWVLSASGAGDFSKARSASLRDAVTWVAADAPAGEHSEMSVKAVVLRADRKRGWLASLPTMASHAGMVGSVMAGSGFMGSKANGVAPAAQVAIFMAPQAPDAPTFDGHEQMIAMLSDPRVDVAQASYAVGDTSRFGAASIQSIWADRIIAANGKPFVKAAGNFGTHLAGSSEFEMSESVFAVGGYVPHSAWLANFGFRPPGAHVLASYSGWGPAGDGGLKPDFLSLTHTLTEGSGFGWYWDRKIGDYNVSGGTSAAGPHGAGHVALLVSAAKQERVPHDAFRLRAAIATTAQFLEGV
ncbi:MAG TPA: S8 family serine peptidase, partial [Steroidobacteraceae bacterium]|nr:S8 family serine peptidase [Steroidobacteraceae bacterium]